MAGTAWFNHYSVRARRSFLLTNGTVIDEPLLEESKSGIKLRIKGTKKSVYKKDKQALIRTGIDALAAQHKTQFWMPIDLDGQVLAKELGFQPDKVRATFDPTIEDSVRATAWWSFKHPTMPIEAIFSLKLQRTGRAGDVYSLIGKVAYPDTRAGVGLKPLALVDLAPNFSEAEDAFCKGDDKDWSDREEFVTYVERHPATWTEGLLESKRNLSERRGVEALLKAVMLAEELECIEIPDMRGDKPAWLNLELVDTNINGRFIDDMREYLDGTTGVDRAVEIYQELVDCLRTIGMVLDTNLSSNDFMRALLNGDQEPLTIALGSPTKDNDSTDVRHSVSVHLPTGTFVVTCSQDVADKDKVAHAWNEAEVMATLTGRKDVLLAYAEEHGRIEHNRRTTQIIDRRRAALDVD